MKVERSGYWSEELPSETLLNENPITKTDIADLMIGGITIGLAERAGIR